MNMDVLREHREEQLRKAARNLRCTRPHIFPLHAEALTRFIQSQHADSYAAQIDNFQVHGDDSASTPH